MTETQRKGTELSYYLHYYFVVTLLIHSQENMNQRSWRVAKHNNYTVKPV